MRLSHISAKANGHHKQFSVSITMNVLILNILRLTFSLCVDVTQSTNVFISVLFSQYQGVLLYHTIDLAV